MMAGGLRNAIQQNLRYFVPENGKNPTLKRMTKYDLPLRRW